MSKKEKNNIIDIKKLCNKLASSGSKESNSIVASKKDTSVKFISTGIFSLDYIMGGGLPIGRVIEIFGQSSVSKSTLALQFVKTLQRKGFLTVYLDMEKAFDGKYAKKIGVDLDGTVISQPDTAEIAIETIEGFIKNGAKLIIVDSVAAMATMAELNKKAGDATIGVLARIMSSSLKKSINLAYKHEAILVFINQVRCNISTFGFGDKYTTPGGKALEFYSSIRLKLERIAKLKKNGKVMGIRVKATTDKNKVNEFGLSCEYDVIRNGISEEADLLDNGVKYGVIKRPTSMKYLYGGKEILPEGHGKGRIAVIKFLEKNEKLKEAIIKDINNKLKELENE
jgi:recombination protein RecA